MAASSIAIRFADGGAEVQLPARPPTESLLRGQPAEAATRLLPRLYALCGRAHELAARLAIDAARGGRCAATSAELADLRQEAIREHARALFLDWPAQFGDDSPENDAARDAALATCPLFRGQSTPEDTRRWVDVHVAGSTDAADALALETGDGSIAEAWRREGRTLPARLLDAIAPTAGQCADAGCPPLPLEPDTAWREDPWRELGAVRQAAASGPFEEAGNPSYETGCWHRPATHGPRQPRHAGDRLMARVKEIVALSRGAHHGLGARAWRLRRGEALAWVGMARGILIHAIRLDADCARIASYRVRAPTDWNFAPGGPVERTIRAQVRSSGAPHGPSTRAPWGMTARVCAAAYAPCYPLEVGSA